MQDHLQASDLIANINEGKSEIDLHFVIAPEISKSKGAMHDLIEATLAKISESAKERGKEMNHAGSADISYTSVVKHYANQIEVRLRAEVEGNAWLAIPKMAGDFEGMVDESEAKYEAKKERNIKMRGSRKYGAKHAA